VNINVLQSTWKIFFKWVSYFRRSVKEVIFHAIIERLARKPGYWIRENWQMRIFKTRCV